MQRARIIRVALLVAGSFWVTGFGQTTQPAADPAPQVSSEDREKSAGLCKDGWEQFQQQQFAQAGELFQQAVELDPSSANAWNGLGWAHFNSGEQQQAEVAFNRCLELAPQHGAALNGLGQLALTQGKPDDAEKWLLKAEMAPAAWWGLARLYLAQEKFDQAEKWLQKIIDNKQAWGQEDQVNRMLEAAKAKEVPPDLKQELSYVLGSQVTRDVQRAFQLMQKGQRDEAQQILDKALEEHPEDPIVLNAVGWHRFNAGDVSGAEEMFNKCLELSPSDLGAMNGKANVMKRQGKVDEAIAMWKQMLEKNPSATAGAWMLAETYMERNEPEKALPLWEKLAKEQAQNKAVQERLERAREAAKK